MLPVLILASVLAAAAPFACNLNALDAAERRRHGELTRLLLKSVAETRELRDGFALKVDGAGPESVGAWIGFERRCCPFLNFRLEAANGALWLRLTGRRGVKEFLRSEFRM